jgi:hypothetical protein
VARWTYDGARLQASIKYSVVPVPVKEKRQYVNAFTGPVEVIRVQRADSTGLCPCLALAMVTPRGVASGDFADPVFQHLQLSDAEVLHRRSQQRGKHTAAALGQTSRAYGFAAGH